jgi:uncharacterized protein YmfQ (DUF2313 family)
VTFGSQSLPGGETLTDEFARKLALLLGPAYQAGDPSLLAEDLRVLGGLLADDHTTLSRAIDQAFATTATDTLPDWEAILDVPPDPSASTEARQAALTAKRRATGGGSAARILAAVRAVDPTALLYPTSIQNCLDANVPLRNVFIFAVVIAEAVYADPAKLAAIERVVDQMKRATVFGNVVTSLGFYFDDSLFDHDAFGP